MSPTRAQYLAAITRPAMSLKEIRTLVRLRIVFLALLIGFSSMLFPPLLAALLLLPRHARRYRRKLLTNHSPTLLDRMARVGPVWWV